MIQRVQTIFLICSVILISIMIFTPLAVFTTSNEVFQLKADSFIAISSTQSMDELVVWPLFILLLIMIIIPFITIFLYKKRMLQIRACVLSSVLNILFYGLFFYEAINIGKELNAQINYNAIVLILPAISILLNLLAIKKIGQDEMLIKSLNSNRIR